MHIYNQPMTRQQFNGYSHGDLLNIIASINMGKKSDLGNFGCGRIILWAEILCLNGVVGECTDEFKLVERQQLFK